MTVTHSEWMRVMFEKTAQAITGKTVYLRFIEPLAKNADADMIGQSVAHYMLAGGK
jgi:hypothetical protein